MKAIAPNGAYCRSIACRLILRAALRYFSDSDRSDVERWDISAGRLVSRIAGRKVSRNALSRESPRHNNSSMLFVMILVTSCRSPFSLSKFDSDELVAAVAVRVSW